MPQGCRLQCSTELFFYGPIATMHFHRILPFIVKRIHGNRKFASAKSKHFAEAGTKVFFAQFVYFSWTLNLGFLAAHSINKHGSIEHILQDWNEKIWKIQRRNWN